MWGTSSALKKTAVAKLAYPEEVWPKSLLLRRCFKSGLTAQVPNQVMRLGLHSIACERGTESLKLSGVGAPRYSVSRFRRIQRDYLAFEWSEL